MPERYTVETGSRSVSTPGLRPAETLAMQWAMQTHGVTVLVRNAAGAVVRRYWWDREAGQLRTMEEEG